MNSKLTIYHETFYMKQNPCMPEKISFLEPQKKHMRESFTSSTKTDDSFFSRQAMEHTCLLKSLAEQCLLIVAASVKHTDWPQIHKVDPQTPYNWYRRFTICLNDSRDSSNSLTGKPAYFYWFSKTSVQNPRTTAQELENHQLAKYVSHSERSSVILKTLSIKITIFF